MDQSMRQRLSLSVVAPCYNEQEVLSEFLRRVQAVCETLAMPYEIVLVDDGSRDRTWLKMAAAAAADQHILAIRLRRNHGHQLALSAGLAAASGDLVLLIDADLQDPPELLPAMINKLQTEDADVVYGQRRHRDGESTFKRPRRRPSTAFSHGYQKPTYRAIPAISA